MEFSAQIVKLLGIVDLIVAGVLFLSQTPVGEVIKYILIIILILKALVSFFY